MDKFYLQVNAVNIITITLMAFVGFAAVGFLSALIRGKFSGGGNSS